MQINGGAAATNNRDVTLNLAASDPLIDGLPGTSSGVTQAAVDIDGDGTFPCSILFNDPNPDSSGCAATFNPATPADPPRRRRHQEGRGRLRRRRPPEHRALRAGHLLRHHSSGARSSATRRPLATDEILLDTVKPIALATQSAFTVEPRRLGELRLHHLG